MVFSESFVSDTLMMVNVDGFLEDEDTQLSSPESWKRDKSFDGENSFEDSVPKGDGEDSDGYHDVEEVRSTYRDLSYELFDISHTDLPRSGVNLHGSGDAASRKRSSTPLRASSVESASEPKHRKVMEDVMGALLGKFGPDESKMVTLGHAAWRMAKQVFHVSTPM